MAGGMGQNILAGAVSGAGTGTALGPLGTIGGGLLGGLMGFISGKQSEKANENIEQLISDTPDFRESEAYNNAVNQAGRADRWAQQGLSSEIMNRAERNIGRVGGTALSNVNSLQSGLMGTSGMTRNLTDAYTDLAVQDAEAKQMNRAGALVANKNLQGAQEDAFGIDMGKHQNMLNLALGDLSSDRADMLGAQQSMGTGIQNLLNSPEAMERFGNFGQNMGGFMGNLFGGNGGGGRNTGGIDDGLSMIPSTSQSSGTMSKQSFNSGFGALNDNRSSSPINGLLQRLLESRGSEYSYSPQGGARFAFRK